MRQGIVWFIVGILLASTPLLSQGTDTFFVSDQTATFRLDTNLSWQPGAPPLALSSIADASDKGQAYTATACLVNTTSYTLRVGIVVAPTPEFIAICRKGNQDTCFYNGEYSPKYLRASLDKPSLIPIVLAPGDTVPLSITYGSITNAFPKPRVFCLNQADFRYEQVFIRPKDTHGIGITIAFLGASLVLMLSNLFLYYQNPKDRLYLYYSGYLFFSVWYFVQKIATRGPFYFLYADFPLLGFILNEPLQFGIYISYNAFVISILQLDKHTPKLAVLIRRLNLIYLVYALFDTVYVSITLDGAFRESTYIITRVFVIVVSIYFLIQILRKCKSPLVPYIIGGTVFFMFFSVLAMLFSIQREWMAALNMYPINFMHIGVFLEALFFSLAIGYRIRLSAVEKQRYFEAYTGQLKENQALIEQTNRELNEKVEERTREIIAQTKALEVARESQLRTEYERKVLESDLNTLRLQMNPHFIFNSLNSIRYYILKQDTPKAAEFIADFARLLRMVLHHSKQKHICLKDELAALDLYLGFEKERLSNQFTFAIHVDPALATGELAIQPLLIQPFAENAIWHGLSPLKDRAGKLTIDIKDSDDGLLQIAVVDNGVGRKSAEALSKQERKSYGLSITRERMEAINKIEGTNQSFDIIDLYDEAGQPAGTKVIIRVRKVAYIPSND